jgi:hypothetical protein
MLGNMLKNIPTLEILPDDMKKLPMANIGIQRIEERAIPQPIALAHPGYT